MDRNFERKRAILRVRLKKLLAVAKGHFPLQPRIVNRKIGKSCICEEVIYHIEGLKEVYREANKSYKIFGAEERLKKVVFRCEHDFTQKMRLEAYKWFERWL